MLYKTIILQLLEDRPQIYNQLKAERKSLATIEALALQLKAEQQAVLADLKQACPEVDQTQLASQSLELALAELVAELDRSLHPEPDKDSSSEQTKGFTLDHCIRPLPSQKPSE